MRMLNKQMRRLLKYGLKYKKQQLILGLLFIPSLLFMVLRPFFIRYLIDDIVANGRESILLPFLALFVLVIIFERVMSFILNSYYVKLSNRVIKNEQIALYNHIQDLDPEYFSINSTGDIITKVLSDVPKVAPIMVVSLPTVLFNGIGLLVHLSVLTILSWRLTLITLCSIPLYYLSLNLFSKKLRQSSYAERSSYSVVNESLREKVEGIWAVKGLVKPKFFGNLFEQHVSDWINKKIKLYINHTAIQNLTFFITAVTPVLVLGIGGMTVMAGALTLGSLMGFFSYMNWIYEPINRINENLISFQSAEPVAQRFFEILDSPKEKSEGNLSFGAKCPISYNNINFAYKQDPILNNINLEIKENERVTLVGMSGSGKSTIANLLCQFYKPNSGVILLNGEEINKYELEEIRKNIQIVRQHDYLFNMTIKENIMLDDDFTDEEMLESLRIAGAEEFIDSFPDKLETIVGERGSKLSDGQKQRLCLARALVRKPKILILDESTSAIDSNTEEKIFERLQEMKQTVVVISHRLSTIRKTDRVIVLHDGQILDSGNHEELLENCPQYKDIVASQLIA